MFRRFLLVAGAAALVLAAVGSPVPVVGQGLPVVTASATCPAAGVTLTTTTETALVTTPGIATLGARTISIQSVAQITSGTAATAITLRVRRGSGTGGTSVGTPAALTVTAGNTAVLAYGFDDTPGESAGLQYTVTAQQTAATANGTAVSCELTVLGH